VKGKGYMTEPHITFYTRKRCPLCEKAKNILFELKNDHPFTFEEIDIDESDELTERYGIMIPVVHMDDEEVAFGIIDKDDISNRLHEKIKNL